MGLMYFKYKILNVEICWKTMYMPTFRKETGKNAQQVPSRVIQTILSKRLNTAGANQMTVFMNGLVNQ